MSGGPPHHPHNRPLPAGNTAWNHLQVPNFFPRQPQHAHMSSEHPIMHQPTWHTPTTEPLKSQIQHSHIINLEQMLSERPYLRQSPGVDLSLSRNSSQNGELPSTPISLSVRDTNKINSLAASALERQGELKPMSPLVKASSPKPASPVKSTSSPVTLTKTKSPTPTSDKQQLSPKMKKVKRVDSILERLNPQLNDNDTEKNAITLGSSITVTAVTSTPIPATTNATTNSSHDENSNSSSILNVPTPREDDVVSPYSNEDSLDSNKSRRKRKPAKTMKVTKDTEVTERAVIEPEPDVIVNNITTANINLVSVAAVAERRKSTSPKGQDSSLTRKTRRKTSSEDETIDKIAAMVGNIVNDNSVEPDVRMTISTTNSGDAVCAVASVPAITTTASASTASTTMVTLAQKKDFVAVEDKLEEMFAGLEDSKADESRPPSVMDDSGFNNTVDLLNLESTPSTSHDKVSSTSNEVVRKKPLRKKRKLKGKNVENAKKKKIGKNPKGESKKPQGNKKMNGKAKIESIKDVYAYDSGSNASSSKSRGPFVHISGPRDSPLSVSVVNTPVNEEDGDTKKNHKTTKKFHDDSEFRHKVRSKGLHCSTLSTKYDAQTKDASWICAFCKRGPYTSEFADNDSYYTPGDLFGPYIITSNCIEYARRINDPYDKSFKSKKIARTLDVACSKQVQGKKTTKRKISETIHAPDEVKDYNLGIAQVEDTTYEIWAHEDCIVWSPGIYLVGPKIVGLEEAVWTASNVSCSRCTTKGANICCLKRGCTNVMHLGCAYGAQWDLDDQHYKAFCTEHSAPS